MTVVQTLQLQAELASLETEILVGLAARQQWLADARPDQLSPAGDWLAWILNAGRGAGKTRTGAEEIWWESFVTPQRVAIVAPTTNDVRKTCYEGESGLLNRIPKELLLDYNRTSLELWMKTITGETSYMIGYSAEEPERLRGPQHSIAWCDELAAWRYLESTWDMLEFTMRLGPRPRKIITTTPKPLKILRDLMTESETIVTSASTFDNEANLPKTYIEKLRKKYEGTRLGQQELHAVLLGDNPNALWSQERIDADRVSFVPELKRIVVAVDPPSTSTDKSDECGIVVAGEGFNGRYYVLEDCTIQGVKPEVWATEVGKAYTRWDADLVVAEVNQGGDMVESVLRISSPNIPVKKVHATRGKVKRAEPVSNLYEQGRVHHYGHFAYLESQMSEFSSDFDQKVMGYSPDRVDALVWAMTELAVLDDATVVPRMVLKKRN